MLLLSYKRGVTLRPLILLKGKSFPFLQIVIFKFILCINYPSAALLDFVNPLRGSNSNFNFSYGATVPAVSLPFGFTFYTPMTNIGSGWKYEYNSNSIQGFGISHIPSPWIGDWGAMQIMATTSTVPLSPTDRASQFSHDEEISKPHYYKVNLKKYQTTVEIAPTLRSSIWRFSFPSGNKHQLLFDTPNDRSGSIEINTTEGTITGYVDDSKRLYVYATVDKPISYFEKPVGQGVCAWIQFASTQSDTVTMRLGTSFISIEQAKANLAQEIGSKSFEVVRDEASDSWEKHLSRVEIEGATPDQKIIFYSNFYRASLYPNAMWEDVNGSPKYSQIGGSEVKEGFLYVNNGFWDTYRSAWPWYVLIHPQHTSKMLQGFLNHYRDNGSVPQWSSPWDRRTMLGTLSDVIFADAYVKGVRGFDSLMAYEAMLKNSLSNGYRAGNDRSRYIGYVPVESTNYSLSWHLEDCIADFGISQMAGALGYKEDQNYFLNKSLDYSKLFSPSVGGFFRGKNLNGTWRTSDKDFYPNEWGHEYVEGSAWQYRVLVPHDGEGLASLFGGRDSLAKAIDDIFEAPSDTRVGSYGFMIHEMREAIATLTGQYGHTNQPTFSMIYMYNYAGVPSKTQLRSRDVLDRLYTTGIGNGNGYFGDEDNGAMSTWYLFSALGFFPAIPGRPEYTIGSPLFTRSTIHLENGKNFTVHALGNSSTNKYIQSAKLNNLNFTRNWISHSEILAGGTLEFVMGPAPSKWGTGSSDLPISVSNPKSVPRGLIDLSLGGSALASSESTPNESASMAFDDNSATKWRSSGMASWIQNKLPNTGGVLGMYTLTSAENNPQYDPMDWILRGSDNGKDWTLLDSRKGIKFQFRNYTRVFEVNNSKPYQYYQLQIEAVNGGNYAQLAELEFLEKFRTQSPVSFQKNQASPINKLSQMKVVHSTIVIPESFRQTGALVKIHTLQGKLIRTLKSSDSILRLKQDAGIEPGAYLVKIEKLQSN